MDVWEGTRKLLTQYGMAEDLNEARYSDPEYRAQPVVTEHINTLTDSLIGRLRYRRDLWREAQDYGMPWAPIRRPEENAGDDHWWARGALQNVHHPELGRSFTYVAAKWVSPGIPWRSGRRPPLLGEHTDEVLAETPPVRPQAPKTTTVRGSAVLSERGRPFALSGVRIIDLTWLLASAGAGRYLTALGAEVIKVEHESRFDGMRFGSGIAPPGGKAEREAATAPIPRPVDPNPNRSGTFTEFNSGKLGMSLNLKHPRGKELLTALLKDADMVIEGFSPGAMDRMGFGYARLREINPRIIYVQQSGMGKHGTYGDMRSYGPTAQGFSGLSDMSGLPEPFAPAGIGYSYLDWFGAYNMANAMMAALYRQRATGEGCYIDTSQVETGIYLTGPAILDKSANGRAWQRTGNRSPNKKAAPHGAYRVSGEDRWIAIGCFTDAQWGGLVNVLGRPEWAKETRFATLDGRLAHHDELDERLSGATRDRDAYELMSSLQGAGVPAGVCQTAEDRYEADPQLRHLGWTVDLDQTEIGRWPVKEVPFTLSDTPPYIGGTVNRAGPNYGEHNAYVLKDILGMSDAEIAELKDQGII
jgi:crotonobetainyl-CoA:carnitine CoA-transferase CaiB-like acyl-CoA transferase